MYKYSKDGVSILTTQDARRKKQSGLYPVKIQVVFNRIQRYYNTGKELSEEDWSALPTTKSPKLMDIRSDIKNSFEKVESIVRTLVEEGSFSFEILNNRLGKCVNDTLNAAFQNRITILNEAGAIGNASTYSCAFRHLEKYAGEKITFGAITTDWLKKYEKTMLSEGKSYTTISMYLRCMRAIFNEAKSVGIVKEAQYPFGKGKYEIPIGKGRKMALNLQQIKQIITYTDGSEATEHYRDLWFFSYLCNGININDLLKLKYSNIDGDELHFYRSKTIHTSKEKKEIEALVTPEMKQIIDKWGNPDKNPNNYIFPFLDGYTTPIEQKKRTQDVTRRINKHLKKIGDNLNISGISTYTARHSFASVLKRSGANIAYISESLGHSDLKTTENYLASFEREEREKNAKLLTNFDNG
ncbi:integrase/recombinase XerD [Dysgonomonas sp. PFB1-18]|uniref:site-specific integrase n=1 Tax=unclassified Dysgonomonas TaxID=2630389 RepID=UPI002474CF4B|nr:MULTISPECIES: site-specific integrase [unclassified Dysgonomonas]MDH6309019.1 integrase/recombinase XerD [Dysgonomonas sp. PF1-14]MDH6338770.1 integrase/recombinase XerD [Dysgonomonas sp. PF1-16]MDH6380202.1 integrase/recombinase XerD [Dysgonomonas sp. PFB1-18]MDH6397532.1 integrase/recombinase XerD [Dysgonomonas sp. PF1-23]